MKIWSWEAAVVSELCVYIFINKLIFIIGLKVELNMEIHLELIKRKIELKRTCDWN